MSDIRLIAMDLDNTLLNSDKVISQHTREVLEEAGKKGIYVVPATGRIFSAIPEFLKDLEGSRYYLCCNGAAVYDALEEEFVYTNYISAEKTVEVLDVLSNYHCTQDIYQKGQGYMESEYLKNLKDYKIQGHLYQLILDTRKPVENLREHIKKDPDGIEKINGIFDDMTQRKDAMEYLMSMEGVHVAPALKNNIEIMRQGCHKGNGIDHLAKHLGLSLDQVMTFGDASNDKEMIEVAGIGVAMDNAMEPIKEVANYVTKTNDQDGVAYAIEKFVL